MEEILDTTPETSNRRRKITKFALAGVAVLGVGAALTSAAWSDNVWFGGSTEAADFELAGSVTGADGTWVTDSTSGVAIALPGNAFDVIAPGVTDTFDVYVQNQGDIPVYLKDALVTVGGAMSGAVTTNATYNRSTLALGQTARVRVSITGTDALGEGIDGTVLIRVEGSSSPIVP